MDEFSSIMCQLQRSINCCCDCLASGVSGKNVFDCFFVDPLKGSTLEAIYPASLLVIGFN